MKRAYISILLTFLLHQILISQNIERPAKFKTYISIGYSNAASSNLMDYYNLILDYYHRIGIPIPTQMSFGKTIVLNTGILCTKFEDAWFGLSLGYLFSPAYSNYQDYAGTLKVNADINSFDILLNIQASLDSIGVFPINLHIQPGASYSSFSLIHELNYFDLPQYNYNSSWSVSEWGPCLQGSIGSSVQLNKFVISFEVGYRFSWNKIYELPVELRFVNYKLRDPYNIGLTGFIFLTSLEMTL